MLCSNEHLNIAAFAARISYHIRHAKARHSDPFAAAFARLVSRSAGCANLSYVAATSSIACRLAPSCMASAKARALSANIVNRAGSGVADIP